MPEYGPPAQAENAYAVPLAEKPAAQAAEYSSPAPGQYVPMPSGTAAQALPSDLAPQTTSQASTPAMADDVDLIEKEWVTRAKEIVERTKDDPRLQNQEMNRVKADYLKKRYDKDIKLDE